MEANLTCPVCNQQFRRPVLLPGCGHNVCNDCAIQVHSDQSDKSNFTCLICNKVSQLQNSSISSLPKNHALEAAIEHLDRVQASQQVVAATQADQCQEHQQALVLVCMSCKDLCCLICAQSGSHKGHKILDIKHAAAEFHKDISNLRNKMSKRKEQANRSLQRYQEVKVEAQQELEDYQKNLTLGTQSFIELLRGNMELRLEQIQQLYVQVLEDCERSLVEIQPITNRLNEFEDPGTDLQKQILFRKAVENLEDLKIPNPEKINLNCALNVDLNKFEQLVQKFGQVEKFELSTIKGDRIFAFGWDPNKKGSKFTLSENNRKVTKHEDGSFHTVYGDTPLEPQCKYRWYLKLHHGSYIKWGVAKKSNKGYDNCFSDHDYGWAWFNDSVALRIHADGSGNAYGEKLIPGDICGISLDTSTGILSFSKNGKDLGVAFKEPIKFCDGDLYPAVSMLYKNESVEVLESNIPFEVEVEQEAQSSHFDFRFDQNKMHNSVQLSNQNKTAKWSNTGGSFRTILCQPAFEANKLYYVRFKISSTDEFKIGLSKDQANYDFAFCDNENGWGFYSNAAELRHNSNSSGQSYGSQVSNGETIGMIIDTKEGNLTYEIKGQRLQPAFTQINKIKEGNIYAAVSFMSEGQIAIEEAQILEGAIQGNIVDFCFDSSRKSNLITLDNNNRRALNSSRGSSFNTVLGNQKLAQNKEYKIGIKIIKGAKIKIGVCETSFTDYSISFGDRPIGWCFYNQSAQLRHDSNNTGSTFGEKMGVGDVILCIIDTKNGRMGFQGNGRDWGWAYENIDKFKSGDILFGVSMLESAEEVEIVSAQINDL